MNRFFLLPLILIYSTFTQAASYVLDKNPRLKYPEIGGKTGYSYFFKKPIEKNVCQIFVNNWNFLISQKISISIGQPVAGELNKDMQKMNWINLNPKENMSLFENLISENNIDIIPSKGMSDEKVASFSARVMSGDLFFRKAEYMFSPNGDALKRDYKLINEEKNYFEIIQYGYADRLQHTSYPYERSSNLGRRRVLAVADKNLHPTGGKLNDLVGFSAQNLWIVNARPYAEFVAYNGDLVISEIELDPRVYLNPVCLLHYIK